MKWLTLFILACALHVNAGPFIIGDVFDESKWEHNPRAEIKKSNIKGGGDVVYQIKESLMGGTQITYYTVSSRTNLVYRYGRKFTSIYKAVAFAAEVCCGEVSLPDVGVQGGRFPLRNVPGEVHRGKKFYIYLRQDSLMDDNEFELDIECMDYCFESR